MWNGVCERHATFVFFFRKEKECFNISKGGNRDGCEGRIRVCPRAHEMSRVLACSRECNLCTGVEPAFPARGILLCFFGGRKKTMSNKLIRKSEETNWLKCDE